MKETINLKELLKIKADADKKIAKIEAKECREAIRKCRVIMKEFGIERVDAKPIKYTCKTTGKTWNGEGRTPKWLERKPNEFQTVTYLD